MIEPEESKSSRTQNNKRTEHKLNITKSRILQGYKRAINLKNQLRRDQRTEHKFNIEQCHPINGGIFLFFGLLLHIYVYMRFHVDIVSFILNSNT